MLSRTATGMSTANKSMSDHLPALERCYYNIYTVWLFTFSDLKTIVFPSTAFGVLNTFAVSVQTESAAHKSPNSLQIMNRIPLVILWTWINLLPFAINNQRQPDSMQEDLLNKPWRPMPSGRMSPKTAEHLMFATYLLAIVASSVLGNLVQCLALIALGFWYNNLKGADASFFVRNFINAGGFICFISGAMQVAIGRTESTLKLLGWWYTLIACIVFSTVQTQDMYDQRGDAIRNRKTVPLVLGDKLARWTIAIPMMIWCWLAPWLWGLSFVGYVAPVFLGLAVATRALRIRTESGDKRTFQVWNLWMVSIYSLPFVKVYEILDLK